MLWWSNKCEIVNVMDFISPKCDDSVVDGNIKIQNVIPSQGSIPCDGITFYIFILLFTTLSLHFGEIKTITLTIFTFICSS